MDEKEETNMWRWLMNMVKKLFQQAGPTPGPAPTPQPAGFIIAPDRVPPRIERQVGIGGSLRFTVRFGRDGSPETEDCILWAFSPGGEWRGGNPAVGVAAVRCNAYDANTGKVKAYDLTGQVSERKLPIRWRAGEVYTVGLRLLAGSVEVVVTSVAGGKQAMSIAGPFGASLVIGYGWPPDGRKGSLGGEVTGVAWQGVA